MLSPLFMYLAPKSFVRLTIKLAKSWYSTEKQTIFFSNTLQTKRTRNNGAFLTFRTENVARTDKAIFKIENKLLVESEYVTQIIFRSLHHFVYE